MFAPTPIDGDNTPALQAFFAGLGDGETVRFPIGASYQLDGTLLIEAKQGLTVFQNGALFYTDTLGVLNKQGISHRTHLRIKDSVGVEWRDFTLRGPNPEALHLPAYEFERGLVVVGSSDVQILSPVISNVYGDFLSTNTCTDVLFEGGRFAICGRQGVGMSGGERNVEIAWCSFDGMGRSCIDIEPNDPEKTVDGVTIRRNTIQGFKNAWVGAGNGVVKDNIYIGYNTVVGKTLKFRHALTSSVRFKNFTIEYNRSETPFPGLGDEAKNPCFNVGHVDGLQIRGNYQTWMQPAKPVTSCVRLVAVTDAHVGDNQFLGVALKVPTEYDDGGNVY